MKKLVLGSLVAMLSVPMLALAGVAKTGSAIKTEPAPAEDTRGSNEETEPRQETYEGNDRGGGDASGGFNEGGGGGGVEGTLFTSVGSTVNQTTEDRGDVLVIRRQVVTPGRGTEICVVSTTKVIDKATQKVIKSDSSELCYDND
ncbi:MAG: hypothetical protein ACKOX6_19020 [Bdellovibrio sp.]